MTSTAVTAPASTTASASTTAYAVSAVSAAWSTTGNPPPGAVDEDQPQVVYVPQAGGAVVGIVHAAPWLAASVEHAKARTSRGLERWPGQPVFDDEDAARAWVAWFRAIAPQTDVDGWTVQPVLVTLDPARPDVLRRVRPVTAEGHRAFWRQPASLLAESARAYLAALAGHLHSHVLPHLELAHAALSGHGVDERTLRQLGGVQELLAGAAAALVDLSAGWASGSRSRLSAHRPAPRRPAAATQDAAIRDAAIQDEGAGR